MDEQPDAALERIGPVNPQGQAMVQELLYIHGLIRANLEAIRELAARVAEGGSARDVHAEIAHLRSDNIVWTLRLGCLRYCRFVHGHHGLEDVALFPGIRRANPGLSPVMDKLVADHRLVAQILDRVERASTALEVVPEARDELTLALTDLEHHLLTHLDYEEARLAPTLERLSEWPFP